jgi:hypothetical protein
MSSSISWQRTVKLIWVVVCVAVLIWSFIYCGQQANPTLRGECSLLGSGVMVLLSLPTGLLWVWLVSAVGYGLSAYGLVIDGSSLIVDFVIWLGFFILGYLQWFKLLPYLIKKWRGRRSRTSPA